jgi:RNA polymerase sigma factor (sigma-70 family)
MTTGQLAPVLRYLRRFRGAAAEDSDQALLTRFAEGRDEEAFAALVRRHGPMVLGACRRVLHDSHDADDAFQAVFLLLVRKAGSLRRPEQLGPWLHGVAHRVALKARALGRRRRGREGPLTDAAAPPAPDEVAWRDLRPILDDAVHALPAKYRTAFVLCCLQGLTHAEAARRIGCPPGTVATRLSRARDQLRARLRRRGVTLSAGALAAALAGRATASVPPALLAGALRAAVAPSAVAAHVAALTEGVRQVMLMEKLRFVVMAVVTAAAVGTLIMGYRSGAAEPPAPATGLAPPMPVGPPPSEDKREAVTVRTTNFEVTAPAGRVARLVAEAAERHRKEQATLWLGKELPAWSERCAIKVRIGLEGVGGATTFSYDAGRVTSRDMHLEGPLDRLLTSALPHEVTHTIFADCFGEPPPRWADEGGAVLSEDEDEQERHAKLMRDLVGKERYIALPRLLKLKDFPDEVMSLYVEGHSLARFLVGKRGRPTFLAFVKQGMKDGWDAAAKEHYGYPDVEELERAWLAAVQKSGAVELGGGMPVERTGLPEEGPLPGVARLQPDGKGIILKVIRTKLHYRMGLVQFKDGRRVYAGLMPLVGHQQIKVVVPLAEAEAYRVDGTALDAKDLSELLKKEARVLVAPARRVAHERLLQLVKEDTLLFVVKATELAEQKPDAANSAPAPTGR